MKKSIKYDKSSILYNYFLFILFIFLLFVSFIIGYTYKNKNIQSNINTISNINPFLKTIHLVETPNFPPKNYDILHNSYSEPLRDDRIYNYNNLPSSFKIPINIPTQSISNTNYRQVGILTRINSTDKETILPLMGKPLITNKDKWNFYTMNDKNNMIKLPIIYKNKRATNDQGIDNLYEGDIVDVLGYTDKFKVSIYDNNVMKYIPYL